MRNVSQSFHLQIQATLTAVKEVIQNYDDRQPLAGFIVILVEENIYKKDTRLYHVKRCISSKEAQDFSCYSTLPTNVAI